MSITKEQIETAQATQFKAAHDSAAQVRLVAGPGTGKSFAVGERVCHLLKSGVESKEITAVSFTRAAARDLALRIEKYCKDRGWPTGKDVSVTTLHSLALRMLRKADLLTHYPTNPLVLDSWEVENVYDLEFSDWSVIPSKSRCQKIRSHHEAFWNTGSWGPPNYIAPNPPISDQERMKFKGFHTGRSQLYCCVLPGEIVRQCVTQIRTGFLQPIELLGIKHLIVDEFQDLNPMDLDLVDELISAGVVTFIAGDDDQSVYSFRYAAPAGIQKFTEKYPACSQHALENCFRCTPSVLAPAVTLIEAYASPGRIPKHLASAYAAADPPIAGATLRWQFKSEKVEARAIASSCRDLIAAGVDPREIMILLSNCRLQSRSIIDALMDTGIDFEPPRIEGFLDSEAGRAVHALVRIACDKDDYVAHRVLLGICRGVGIPTCKLIADAVLANNLNFRDLFYQIPPDGVLKGHHATAVARIRSICAALDPCNPTDSVFERGEGIAALLAQLRPETEIPAWDTFKATLPPEMSLRELCDFLWADNPGQQARVLEAVYRRIGKELPEEGLLPKRVRLMTMHSAKGLDAQVVFVPGLEEEIIPGHWRAPYPGLVFEAARLLYMSITRARAVCIVSLVSTRMTYGRFKRQTPSRFCGHLGGAFSYREHGLSAEEVTGIVASIGGL